MKKLKVTCYYRNGMQEVTINLVEEEGYKYSDDEICTLAHEELKRQGAGYNSEMLNFIWDENDVN